jgi:signal transduction histidine kinase
MCAQAMTKELLLSEIATMRQQMLVLQDLVGAQQDAKTRLDEQGRVLALCADIGATLAGTDSLRTMLQRCAEAMVQHLHAATAGIWTLPAKAEILEMQASAGIYLPLGNPQGIIPVGLSEIGWVAQKRQPYMTNVACGDPRISDQAWVQRSGIVAFAGYPLLVEARLVGVLALFARDIFTPTTQEALAWVAGVLAIGIDRVCIADALARSLMQIVRSNKGLQRKNAELGELTSLASRDLQQPLQQLTALSQLLRHNMGEDLPPQVAQDLSSITKAAEYLHTLIHNFLMLSRLENAVMHWEQVALDTCVDHALATLAKSLDTTKAHIQRDALPKVRGDRAMLTQIYYNLLDNALKFAENRQSVISVTAAYQNSYWTLGVKDNGIGIAPTMHELIFTPYKRLHSHNGYAGTGVGLAICRKAVERHGGMIWIESQVGQGTHVKFTLPAVTLTDADCSPC